MRMRDGGLTRIKGQSRWSQALGLYSSRVKSEDDKPYQKYKVVLRGRAEHMPQFQ